MLTFTQEFQRTEYHYQNKELLRYFSFFFFNILYHLLITLSLSPTPCCRNIWLQEQLRVFAGTRAALSCWVSGTEPRSCHHPKGTMSISAASPQTSFRLAEKRNPSICQSPSILFCATGPLSSQIIKTMQSKL